MPRKKVPSTVVALVGSSAYPTTSQQSPLLPSTSPPPPPHIPSPLVSNDGSIDTEIYDINGILPDTRDEIGRQQREMHSARSLFHLTDEPWEYYDCPDPFDVIIPSVAIDKETRLRAKYHVAYEKYNLEVLPVARARYEAYCAMKRTGAQPDLRRYGRGQSSEATHRPPGKQRVLLKWDIYQQPIGYWGKMFTNLCGIIAKRPDIFNPYFQWREHPFQALESAWRELSKSFVFDDPYRAWRYVFDKKMVDVMRDWRLHIKSEYYDAYTADFDRFHHLPSYVDPIQFGALMVYWEGEVYAKRSTIGKSNCQKRNLNITLGSQSISNLQYRRELDGQRPMTVVEVVEEIHREKRAKQSDESIAKKAKLQDGLLQAITRSQKDPTLKTCHPLLTEDAAVKEVGLKKVYKNKWRFRGSAADPEYAYTRNAPLMEHAYTRDASSTNPPQLVRTELAYARDASPRNPSQHACTRDDAPPTDPAQPVVQREHPCTGNDPSSCPTQPALTERACTRDASSVDPPQPVHMEHAFARDSLSSDPQSLHSKNAYRRDSSPKNPSQILQMEHTYTQNAPLIDPSHHVQMEQPCMDPLQPVQSELVDHAYSQDSPSANPPQPVPMGRAYTHDASSEDPSQPVRMEHAYTREDPSRPAPVERAYTLDASSANLSEPVHMQLDGVMSKLSGLKSMMELLFEDASPAKQKLCREIIQSTFNSEVGVLRATETNYKRNADAIAARPPPASEPKQKQKQNKNKIEKAQNDALDLGAPVKPKFVMHEAAPLKLVIRKAS